MPMNVTANPNPFPPAKGYRISVYGGTPPFTYTPVSSPPNPAGVTVTPSGAIAWVQVPDDTPPAQIVAVAVTDSSDPPVTVPVSSITS